MNIHSHAPNYFPKATHPGFRQNVQRKRGLVFPGGVLLWSAVGKVTLAILPIVLACNLLIASAINTVETRVQSEQQSLVLATKENALLGKDKGRLLSPVRVQVVAAEKLSLKIPCPEQIKRM